MSLAAKKKVIGGILLAMVLWPLAHCFVCLGYGINPWKFFGWAMYAAPPPRYTMSLGETVGERIDWARPRSLPPDVVENGFRFLKLRNAYGELLPPKSFAAAVLAAFPDMEAAAIRVRSHVLDRTSARIETLERTYVYPRRASGDSRD